MMHRSELEEAGERYQEFGLKKRWYSLVNHAEVGGRGHGTARLDREDGLVELRADPRFAQLSEPVQRGLEAWPDSGYLVVEGMIDRERVDRINSDVDELVAAGSLHEHHVSSRFMNIHGKSQAAAGVVSDPGVLEMLDLILGRPARPFQTIGFVRGSQQEAHSDAFHMMTEPPGFLVGVWVALEDIDADSGPVFYHPGSHRLPYVMSEDLELPRSSPILVAEKGAPYLQKMREMTSASGAEPSHFTAKAGDVLFWHHNLLHGGSAIARSDSTRRSLVIHYFAENVLCYHEVTERPALMAAA